MGERPSVWAVVVNWNGRDVLEPCLRTLLASRYGPLSVVVVDNASTDDSLAMVETEFPDVRVVRESDNRGYAAGANVGLRLALEGEADYVLLLNNDTEIDADAVSALVATAEACPDCAFVGPLIYYADPPDVIWSAGGRVSYWTGKIYHLGLRERDSGRYSGPGEVDYVTGCAILASMKAVRDVGLMDESYYMYNEDTDWCTRARTMGYRVVVEPSARLWHKVSTSSGGGLTPFKIYNRILSTAKFFSIHAKPYHWLGIAPCTLGRAFCFAVSQLAHGGGANVRALCKGASDWMLRRERR